MADISALEEEIQQLKVQNLELAQSLNHWKVQCKLLEQEKIETMKENNYLLAERNRYRECAQKNKQMKLSVEKSAKQLLETVVDASNHIVKIVNLVQDRHQDTIDEKKILGSPLRHTSAPTTPISNVHHVRPMIRGVTLKNPIIRVSRAILDPSPRSVTLTDDVVPVDRSSPPPQDTISPARTKMLDLCVTLRRADLITQRLQGNFSTEANDGSEPSTSSFNSGSRPTAFSRTMQQSRSPILQESQDTVNFNGSNRFLEDNLSGGDSRSIYENTLGCVVEESEPETSEYQSISPEKLNPFIVLKRGMPSSPMSHNLSASIADEDPLEGPSWLLDSSNGEEYKPKKTDFVSMRRKITAPLDSSMTDMELFEDSNQVPDSTTSGKDIAEQLERSVPPTQSTPNGNEDNETQRVCPNNTNDVDKTAEEQQPNPQVADLNSDSNTRLTAKVSIEKMEETVCLKSSKASKKKVSKGRKRKKDSKSNLPLVTIEPIVSIDILDNVTNELSCNETSVSNASESSRISDDNLTTRSMKGRPRRGEQRDYREISLNKKLRRN